MNTVLFAKINTSIQIKQKFFIFNGEESRFSKIKCWFPSLARLLSRGLQIFSVMGKVAIILGFVSYIVSVATTQLCSCTKVAMDNTYVNRHG